MVNQNFLTDGYYEIEAQAGLRFYRGIYGNLEIKYLTSQLFSKFWSTKLGISSSSS